MRFRDLIPFKKKSINQTQEGGLNTSWDWGWWQQGKQPTLYDSSINSTVEACVSALSQTTAMCPLFHLQDRGEEGEKRNKGSHVERVMLRPNSYQTRSSFFVNAIRSMYLQGNAYAVATRNEVNTITSLQLMDPRSTRAYVDPESGAIFYFVSPYNNQPIENFNSETDRVFPSRDVLHLRLYTGNNPLNGETPLTAALNAVATNNAITGHQKAFFHNMSRPSGTLSTENKLTKEKMDFLRNRWNEQSADINSGKVPILSDGLKFEAMSLTSQDSQLVEAYGLTVADISRAFRVPLVLVNDMSGATFNNAEQTMSFFLMSGLQFLLDHIELELARLFNLPFNESVNFDTDVLLRTDFAARIKALGDGVLKGIYSPNEARRKEKLAAVEGGEEPRVQKQVVPLSAYDREQTLAEETAANDAVDPDPEVDPPPEGEPEVDDEEAEERALLIVRSEYKKVMQANAR